jgi:hypothetical protein
MTKLGVKNLFFKKKITILSFYILLGSNKVLKGHVALVW